ncbi:MAG: hypothetical protein V4539_18990 [Bacteroidota bacterium]
MLKPTILLIFLSTGLFAQTNYKGYINKYPIELVTHIYSDGDARAIYAYRKYQEPIVVNGRQRKDTLVLYEKDKQGKIAATLTFLHFDQKKKNLTGIWKSQQTKQELSITLDKEFDIEYGEGIEYNDREIIQRVSLNNYYFKLVISKTKDAFYAGVTGIKILQKKTDSLVQFIATDCQLSGLDNTMVDDYNFDGIKEFSLFESSYAGPNTSRIYFLYDPKTKKYIDAKFEGVSLDFDPKTKRISEHNQCCGGRQHTTAEYKVVNNKMILVAQHCYVWDEKKQDLVERKMADCQ